MDLRHSEIDEAVVCRMQKAQAAAEEESCRGDDEGQDGTVNPERQACARTRGQVKHIPNSKQVRDDRHRKDNHSLHRNRDVVDKSRYEERRQGDQQKRRRHRDPRHAAGVRVVEDVEEIASELKGVSFCEAELAAQGDVPLLGAEAAEGTASEIALRGGRYRHGEHCGVDDLAPSFSVSATSVVVNAN